MNIDQDLYRNIIGVVATRSPQMARWTLKKGRRRHVYTAFIREVSENLGNFPLWQLRKMVQDRFPFYRALKGWLVTLFEYEDFLSGRLTSVQKRKELETWAKNQRARRYRPHSMKRPMSKGEILLLSEIGFEWQPKQGL